MAFIPSNLFQQSFNPPLSYYVNGIPQVRVPLLWGYGTSTDTIATVSAAGYFTPFSDFFISGFTNQLGVGDIINCVCSNGVVQLTVTQVLNGVVTTAVEVGANSVDTAAIQNLAVTTAKIADANVTLAKLAAGITPSHVIKFGGQLTTVGGAAAEAFAVVGAVAATDMAFVQIVDNGSGNVTALQAVVTNNVLTVTFSGNPGADTIFNYQIIRAAA